MALPVYRRISCLDTPGGVYANIMRRPRSNASVEAREVRDNDETEDERRVLKVDVEVISIVSPRESL